MTSFRQSIASLETDLEEDDSNIQIKDDLAACLIHVGKLLNAKGDLMSAADAFRKAVPLAQEVIDRSPFNVRYKARHADSFSEAGKFLVNLSKSETGQKRDATASEACDNFRRSVAIWNELRANGTLSAIYTGRLEEVSRLILTKCP